MAFTEAPIHVVTNNATRVEVVAAPSSGRKVVRNLVVFNRDTASGTFTLEYKDGSTYYELAKFTLDAGDQYQHDALIVLDDDNDSITVVLGGPVATRQWHVTGAVAEVT